MYARHEDDEPGYCPDCGCDLNPLGWFVMHKPDCAYRAVERRAEDARAFSQYGLTPEEANREVSDEEFAATLQGRAWPPRKARKDLRPKPPGGWRYDHPYKWSASGPECDLCGFVHEPNHEPEGGAL